MQSDYKHVSPYECVKNKKQERLIPHAALINTDKKSSPYRSLRGETEHNFLCRSVYITSTQHAIHLSLDSACAGNNWQNYRGVFVFVHGRLP